MEEYEDYFKKTEEEKAEIQKRLFEEYIQLIDENKLSKQKALWQLDKMIEIATQREHYELAQLFVITKENITTSYGWM